MILRLAIAEIAKIPVDQTQDAPSFLLQFGYFVVLEILLVIADVEVIDLFFKDTAPTEKKSNLIGKVISSMSFGYVVCK